MKMRGKKLSGMDRMDMMKKKALLPLYPVHP
jgi:hypothetical protein